MKTSRNTENIHRSLSRVSTRSYEQGGNVHKTRWGEGQEWMENGIGRSEYRRGEGRIYGCVV